MLSHGFPAVNFVVVNSMATANESNSLALLRSKAADIPVYQETPSEPVWGLLGGKNASIVVFDRCGRMAYQLVAPWSSPDHQYIKAAILSAYRDNVCGPCRGNRARSSRMSVSPAPRQMDETWADQTSTKAPTEAAPTSSEQSDQSTTPVSQNLRDHQGPDIFEAASEEVAESSTTAAPHTKDSNFTWNRNLLLNINGGGDTDYEQQTTSTYGPVRENVPLLPLTEINDKIPIRVIYRDPHKHTNSAGHHDYVVLQTGNPNYHGHLPKSAETSEPMNALQEPTNTLQEPTNTLEEQKNILRESTSIAEQPTEALEEQRKEFTKALDAVQTVNNSVRVEIIINDIEKLNLTTSRESSNSVELLATPEPYFSEKVEVTADDLVDEDFSATREWTRQNRKKRRRKQRRKYRPSIESVEYEWSATTPSIVELVEERQRDIDSEQNMLDVIEQDDIVKLKIIESYRRLVPWLDYDL